MTATVHLLGPLGGWWWFPPVPVEQYGRYLPVHTDNLFSETVCIRAAEAAQNLLVCASLIHYGFDGPPYGLFGGTVTVESVHCRRYFTDVAKTFCGESNAQLLERAPRPAALGTARSWRACPTEPWSRKNLRQSAGRCSRAAQVRRVSSRHRPIGTSTPGGSNASSRASARTLSTSGRTSWEVRR